MTDAEFNVFYADLPWKYGKTALRALRQFCLVQSFEAMTEAVVKFISIYEGKYKPPVGSLIKTLRGMTQGASDTIVPPDETEGPDLPWAEMRLSFRWAAEYLAAEIPRDRLAAIKRYMDARDRIGKPVAGRELENMQKLIAKNDAESASNASQPPDGTQIPAPASDAPGASIAPASAPADECEMVMGPDIMQQGEKWESPL